MSATDTALALPSQEQRDLAEARTRLARMREWIEAAQTAEDIGAAANALREAREWMRIKKVAADLRAEAARIEAIALRRIGLLGATAASQAGLSTAYKAAASGFAALDEAEFDDLLERTAALTNPVAIWNVFRRDRERWWRKNQAIEFARGNGRVGPYETPRDVEPEDVAGAVRTLLADASTHGDRFTVAELTDSLVSWVIDNSRADSDRMEPPFVTDPDFRQGMAEVVRHALRSEALSSDPRMPAFITYYDGNEGWVRIPWDAANIDDLRAMARIRREQASDLAESAAKLEALLGELEGVSAENGREKSLARLASMHARNTLAAALGRAS